MEIRAVVVVLALYLGVAVSISAQSPISLTKEVFEDLTQKAFAKTATRMRRETTRARTLVSGKLVEEELTTQDYSPPDRERWLILARTPTKATRVEIVYIGSTEYRREDRGGWKKADRVNDDAQYTLLGNPPSSKLKEIVTYSKQQITRHGKKEQVLVKTSNLAYSSSPGLHTRRIKLDQEGYITKIEESVSEGPAANVVYTSVSDFVYVVGRTIVIEAPVE